jgi:pseudaminic acid synthase
MKIGDFIVGNGKTFIIAEMSGNHNGDIAIAKETIRAAKRAGADCIKLQTYTADTITLNVRNDHFKVNHGTVWDGRYLYDLYEEAHTPWEWHQELFDLAKEEGLICFSSPFDPTAVDLLESLDAPAYKIASYEITDIPLIKYAASKGKPMIISTGIADESDIQLAIEACLSVGNDAISILKCTSAYPTPPEDANLITIPAIKEKFNVIPGFSDHTMGIEAPIVAVALGAQIIEKHFILDRNMGGVDSHFSLDEKEFSEMVQGVRTTEKLLGKVDFSLDAKKRKNREHSRSLYITKDMQQGERFTALNVRSVRPGNGMHPKHFEQVLKQGVASRALKSGTPLGNDMITMME